MARMMNTVLDDETGGMLLSFYIHFYDTAPKRGMTNGLCKISESLLRHCTVVLGFLLLAHLANEVWPVRMNVL
jgi:hypothetical protein